MIPKTQLIRYRYDCDIMEEYDEFVRAGFVVYQVLMISHNTAYFILHKY